MPLGLMYTCQSAFTLCTYAALRISFLMLAAKSCRFSLILPKFPQAAEVRLLFRVVGNDSSRSWAQYLRVSQRQPFEGGIPLWPEPRGYCSSLQQGKKRGIVPSVSLSSSPRVQWSARFGRPVVRALLARIGRRQDRGRWYCKNEKPNPAGRVCK